MDRAVKGPRRRTPFGADRVEWAIVVVVGAVAGVGVFVMSGSIVAAAIVAILMVAATATFVAML